MTIEEHPLPDGSTAHVERLDFRSSLISRLVDGRCVWGQMFARSVDHDGQVARVVAKMTARPTAFAKWQDQ